ncbi:MAG TPA: nucleotidyltransferase domain-containing protein [Methylomusa anaerophila]|uniref:Nucleotidyltransferase domain protein n=1 Tax=Methylomusa anaerophila TaxID=1930071 RepID=A0A348AJ36_9FIRM|nr:nucleotidyltransferase domain-containing protein [Methylomusa anaerophila]BBB91084.1 nucleotidyltransferase domain protein [Methylomusa anaerophila]HML88961.1 nucleotidyltransferase domain-containing protein [Methylomusa anaerophila]
MVNKEEVISKLNRAFPVLRDFGKYKVKRIGLYGSVARGDNGPDSDIDILVEFFNKDDTTAFRGTDDVKRRLEPLFKSDILHVEPYPIPDSDDPKELIWIEG